MQKNELNKQAEWIKEQSVNDSKRKGEKPSTPKEDNITSDIKSTSITNDVDGYVFSVSYHSNPKKFYSFKIPNEYYGALRSFHEEYNYTRTPKKKEVDVSSMAGVFAPSKSEPDLFQPRKEDEAPW